MNQKRQPLTGQWQDLFQNPAKLSEESRGKPLCLNKALIQDYDISGVQFFNATFDDTEWNDVTGKKSQLVNVTFKNSNLADVDFSFSTLTDVTFENVTFVSARFHHSTFVNVRFQDCKILDPQKDYFRSFSGLKVQDVKIVNSKLQNITFFESQGDFQIKESQLEDVSFAGLTFPSSMNINSSQLEHIKFDNSNLTTFTVTGSQLKNTSAQDSNIGKIVISNSTLDISFERSTIEEMRVSETINELLGLLSIKINSASISFCKQAGDIALPDGQFNSLKIDNCNDLDLTLTGAIGKELMVKNSVLKKAKFKKMAVDHFVLDNVEFTGETNFDKAQAKKSEVRNIKKSPGAIVTAIGSNIRLY
jgi:uncharacterized protein YjbI with pentapeptide repeats